MFAVPLKILTLSTKQRAEDDELLTPLVVHDNGIEAGEDGGQRLGPPDTGTQLDEDLSMLRRLRRFFEVSDWDGDGDEGVDLLGGNRRHVMLLSGGPLASDPEYAGFSGERNSLWGYTMMQRYHASLVEAESRGFPAADDYPEGPEDTVAWTSAFGTGKTVHRAGIRTERACVLFSVAALESYMGAYLTTRVGAYAAIWRYQNAAGMFKHIREMEVDSTASIPDGDGPCSDLSSGCLSALEFLMLAQAQTCIYEKIAERWTGNGPTDAAQNTVECEYLATLAAGIAWLYEKAVASVEDGAPHMYSRWGHAMKANLALYRALAQHWQSWLDEEKANVTDGAGLGLAEGRLRLSLDFMTTDAIVHAEKGRMEMSTFEENIMKLTARLHKVEKENRLKLREQHVIPNLIPMIPHITLVHSRTLAPEFFPQKVDESETCLDSLHNNYSNENDKSGIMGVLSMDGESASSRISDLIDSVSNDDDKSVPTIVDFLNMEDVHVSYRNLDRSASGLKKKPPTNRNLYRSESGSSKSVSLEPITEHRHISRSERMAQRDRNKEEESKTMRSLAMEDKNTLYRNSDLPESVLGPSPKIEEEGEKNHYVRFLEMEDTNISYRDIDLPESVLEHRHFERKLSKLVPFLKRRSSLGSSTKLNQDDESQILDFLDMEDTDTDYQEDDLDYSFIIGPSVPKKEEDAGNNICYLDMEDTDITYKDIDISQSVLEHRHFEKKRSRLVPFLKQRSSSRLNKKLNQEDEAQILDFLDMEDNDTADFNEYDPDYQEYDLADSTFKAVHHPKEEEDAENNDLNYLEMDDTTIRYKDLDPSESFLIERSTDLLPGSVLEYNNCKKKPSKLLSLLKRPTGLGLNSTLKKEEETQTLNFLDMKDADTDYKEYDPDYKEYE